MRVVKVTYLTDEVWGRLPDIPEDEQATLAKITTTYFILMDGEQILAVMGLMPQGLLSNSYVIWFGFVRGYDPDFRVLRALRGYFKLLQTAEPDARYLAEVDPQDSRARRFAEFFGFELRGEKFSRQIFERVN